MSKVVALFQFDNSGMTREDYEKVLSELKAEGKLFDERRPSHVAFQKGDNFCVIDVWNSEEELNDFAQNTLFPIFKKVNVTPQPPEVYSVHNYLGVHAEEAISI
jgi:hypothetical protein